MNVIIIGAGEVGIHIAERLVEERHNVVIIDKSPRKILELSKKLDVLTVIGYGSDFVTLNKAGIKECDVLIAATDLDETNMIACFVAKKFNVLSKIARIRRHFIEDDGSDVFFNKEELGIDVLINPEDVTTDHIMKLIISPAAFEIIDFDEEELIIKGFHITSGLKIASLPIRELGRIEELKKMLIIAILRDDEMIIPQGKGFLYPGDRVYIIAKKDDFAEIAPYFHETLSYVERVFIIGISSITHLLCMEFQKEDIDITVIEEDADKCIMFSERYHKIEVVNCNITDRDALLEEGLSKVDAFIAVSDDEEKNILSSMIAKKENVPKTIASIQKKDYIPFAHLLGIDAVVIPKIAIVGEILKYIRKGNVLSVVTLGGSNAEVVEYLVKDSYEFIGTPLRKIRFPEGCLVLAIIRFDERIIPKGDDIIEKGDRIMVFAKPEALTEVRKFFS